MVAWLIAGLVVLALMIFWQLKLHRIDTKSGTHCIICTNLMWFPKISLLQIVGFLVRNDDLWVDFGRSQTIFGCFQPGFSPQIWLLVSPHGSKWCIIGWCESLGFLPEGLQVLVGSFHAGHPLRGAHPANARTLHTRRGRRGLLRGDSGNWMAVGGVILQVKGMGLEWSWNMLRI